MTASLLGVSSDTMVPRLTAEMLPSLLSQQEDIRKQLDVARLSGASDEDKAKLMAQMDAITSLIQRWAEFNGTTVADAIASSVKAITSSNLADLAAKQLQDIQTQAFQNFDAIIQGTAIPQLQETVGKLTQERAIAIATGATQAVIDAITLQLAQAQQQLIEDQQVYGAAAAAGLIPVIQGISDATIQQIVDMEKKMADGGKSLIGTIAKSVEDGTLSIASAMQVIPQDVLPDLQSLEQSLTVQLAEALLTGADNADALAAALARLDDFINQVDASQAKLSSTLGAGTKTGGGGTAASGDSTGAYGGTSNVRTKGPAGGSYDEYGNPDPSGDYTTIIVNGPLTKKKGANNGSGVSVHVTVDDSLIRDSFNRGLNRRIATTITPYSGAGV